MKVSISSKVAIKIGSVCIGTYLVSYFFRNMLSVFAPEILEEGVFGKTEIAFFSSLYMIVYAAGQLVNGIVGDYVKSKYMAPTGLIIGGIGLLLFSILDNYYLMAFSFAILGFGLSMLRGPLVKLITENTRKRQSNLCCTLFSVASFLGPFIASVFAFFFKWRFAFLLAAVISFAFAIGSFFFISKLEKEGIVRSKLPAKKQKISVKDILSVFTIDGFLFYLFVALIVEIAATSILFWIPTYMTDYLKFSVGTSGVIFSSVSCINAVCPFACLGLLSLFKDDDVHLVRTMFLFATVMFLLLSFVTNIWINIVVLILALSAFSIASSTLWSVYIPSIASTGKTSSANGILDCSGYFAASVMNMIFAVVVEKFSWRGMIISWMFVALLGYIITVAKFFKNRIKNSAK